MFNSYDISLIKKNESRKYFEDVLQSFYSKNYRATVLLLYSLLIDDLYYKLILMNDRKYYNLNEEIGVIDNLNNAKKYSDIEEKIFDTYKSKHILSHDTIDMVEYFKKIRNKCAHPAYFKEEKYEPSQEEVNMFIVKIYKNILIKEAFIKDPYSIIKPEIENKEWGSIIDVNMGYTKHENNYIPFKLNFTSKYFEKLSDNNFQKLFGDLIKVIIIKNGEWEKTYQYQNMMLMESLLEYLNLQGKMNLLENCYDWARIQEECIYDDNHKEVYQNEWFATTYMLKILTYNNFFIQELRAQNEIVYNKLSNEILKEKKYVLNYWNLFFKFKEELCNKINNVELQGELLQESDFIDNKKIAIEYLENIFKNIPTTSGFTIADNACDLLINCIDKYKLNKQDIEKILQIMNTNSQIFFNARNKSKSQFEMIKNKGIDMSEYSNLN